jgi:hypothetical protein
MTIFTRWTTCSAITWLASIWCRLATALAMVMALGLSIFIPLPATAASKTSIPGPNDLQGLQQSGRIDAKSGQVIENLEISNPNGPCVVIAANIKNVIVRNNRIGPCGPSRDMTDYGVFILENASDITVAGNVIHDVGSGVKAYKAEHPVIVEKNFFYNIRGPLHNGQAVQFALLRGDRAASRVSCNVSDANYGSGNKFYEDHISIYKSDGTAQYPIDVSYNRVRGGTSKSGGGITVGDKGGSWINVHDNVVVTVANSGIGVAGGNNIRIENNRVDNRGKDRSSLTHNAYFVRGISQCNNIVLKGNRGIARLWNWGETRGDLVQGYKRGVDICPNTDDSDNQFGDETLSPEIFDVTPAACR